MACGLARTVEEMVSIVDCVEALSMAEHTDPSVVPSFRAGALTSSFTTESASPLTSTLITGSTSFRRTTSMDEVFTSGPCAWHLTLPSSAELRGLDCLGPHGWTKPRVHELLLHLGWEHSGKGQDYEQEHCFESRNQSSPIWGGGAH